MATGPSGGPFCGLVRLFQLSGLTNCGFRWVGILREVSALGMWDLLTGRGLLGSTCHAVNPRALRTQLGLKASQSLPQVHAVDGVISAARSCFFSGWDPSDPRHNETSVGFRKADETRVPVPHSLMDRGPTCSHQRHQRDPKPMIPENL